MTLRINRRHLFRAGACVFTGALTIAPLLAPRPSGRAFAATASVLPGDARRIVAVGGSITEIFYALGEEGRLVARDSTSQYPEAASQLPDVGYMRALSPEGVLSVDPDGIIALEGSGPPEAIQVLEKASVPFVMIPERFDSRGIVDKVRAVGAAIGETAKADTFAQKVEADLRAAEDLTRSIAERRKVLFVLSLQGGKILASGGNSAANGIIEMAGGVNAITGFDGYRQLTDESVIEAQPDLVLMMARGDSLDVAPDEIFSHPAVAATPAGQNRELVRMDGLYLLGFGPRTAEAVRNLAHRLYGDKVKG